jgi:hypothetical protein
MKTMTCLQLGGACDLKFHAESFDEMADLSRAHGKEMFQMKDEAHLKTMGEMKDLMNAPSAMQQWFEDKRKEFEALPVDA